MKTKKHTPKQTKTPRESQVEEATPKWFADIFDGCAKRIREERNSFAYRQGDPELKATYSRWTPFVERWRDLAIKNLKDCPALPDVPQFVGEDYFGGMIHLEDFCKSCAAKLRGKAEPLSKNAEIVYDLLVKLPPHKALTVPEILDIVNEKHEKAWDEKELYERVFPQLRQWGLNNKPRIGYWIVK